MDNEHVVGTFTFEKATTNTYRYKRTADNGRTEVQYIPKSVFPGEKPESILVVIKW